MKGNIIRSEQVSNDMYVSIDLVEEVIERQLRKYKNKIVERHQDGGNLRRSSSKEVEDDERDQDHPYQTFRDQTHVSGRCLCVQMELLGGHNFFVFRNAENDEVCVVYKRKGNTYGLIEPEC